MHNHSTKISSEKEEERNSRINSTGESKEKMEIDNGENVTVDTKFHSIALNAV